MPFLLTCRLILILLGLGRFELYLKHWSNITILCHVKLIITLHRRPLRVLVLFNRRKWVKNLIFLADLIYLWNLVVKTFLILIKILFNCFCKIDSRFIQEMLRLGDFLDLLFKLNFAIFIILFKSTHRFRRLKTSRVD